MQQLSKTPTNLDCGTRARLAMTNSSLLPYRRDALERLFLLLAVCTLWALVIVLALSTFQHG
jgi:hypothetical protein